MKAYLYNSENGIYEGEAYEDADMVAYEDGITIVPPPPYSRGQVPVFDRCEQVWQLKSVSQLIQQVGEEKTRDMC